MLIDIVQMSFACFLSQIFLYSQGSFILLTWRLNSIIQHLNFKIFVKHELLTHCKIFLSACSAWSKFQIMSLFFIKQLNYAILLFPASAIFTFKQDDLVKLHSHWTKPKPVRSLAPLNTGQHHIRGHPAFLSIPVS